MNASIAFSVGLAVAAAAGFAVARYLNNHIKGILVDLCRSESRADFWMAFSNVILLLVPLIFGMQFNPGAGNELPIVLQLGYQLKWVFIGLVASVMSLGMILAMFIRQDPGRPGVTSLSK